MRILLVVLCVLIAGCKEAVLHDLSERDATAVIFNLHHEGIAAHKSRSASGWSVLVARAQLPRATAVMTRSGFLRAKAPEMLHQQKRFFLSRSERAHVLELSIAARIEETLEALPEVLDAKVNLFLAPQEGAAPLASKIHASASAVLIVSSRFAIGENSIVKIIRGAAAIEERRVEVVLVTDTRYDTAVTGSATIPTGYASVTGARTTPNAAAESDQSLPDAAGNPHIYFVGAALALAVVGAALGMRRRRRRVAFAQRMAQEQEFDSTTRGIFRAFRNSEDLVQ